MTHGALLTGTAPQSQKSRSALLQLTAADTLLFLSCCVVLLVFGGGEPHQIVVIWRKVSEREVTEYGCRS